MRIVAGQWRGRKLVAPKGESTRPTADRTRETLFNMLASRLGSFEDLRVADLFAGSGALVTVRVDGVIRSDASPIRQHDPGHPMADANGDAAPRLNDVQFTPERFGHQKACHHLADMGDKAVALADQAGIVGLCAGAGGIDRGFPGKGDCCRPLDPRHCCSVARARQAERPVASHSSVRISTVSPSSRNRKNGAHAASRGG